MSQLFDLINISQNLPARPSPLIRRENILTTIDRYFDADIEVIGIEGEDGFGKTTLLGEFSRKYSQKTFSIFLRPTSQIGYDPKNVRFDIANQIQWYMHSEQLPEDMEVDDGVVRQKFGQLQRRAARSREIFYLVIDGLDELPADAEQIKESILDVLPIGLAEFRLIFSGDIHTILGVRYRKLVCKTLPLPPFSYPEAHQYLEDIISDKPSREEINRTCLGIPGHLASVRRLIVSGHGVKSVLDELPQKLPDLFLMEWESAAHSTESEKLALAALAYLTRRRTLDEISELISVDVAELGSLTKLPFLEVDEAGTVQFVSEGFRQFAASKLENLKQTAIDAHITFLRANPLSSESLTCLPRLLNESGKYDELIDVLTIDHFVKAIEYHSTLHVAHGQLRVGLNIAHSHKIYEPVMKFSLFGSVLSSASDSEILRSELDARLALGQDEVALGLANSAPLIEDRIRLLSHVCRTLTESGKEPGLQSQIRNLTSQLSPDDLDSERALDIASDLFAISPELAISIIEKVSSADGDNAVDKALMKLTIEVLRRSPDSDLSPQGIHTIKTKITHEKIRETFAAVEVFLSPKSAKEVIAEVEGLKRPGDALFVIRSWLSLHSDKQDAATLIQYALELSIRSTTYAPNASFYRDVAAPLPNMEDQGVALDIVGLLDGQQALIRKQGPTTEYVRMELLLAETELKVSLENSCNRLTGLYLDTVSQVEDVSIRAICLAWFAATLYKIDVKGEIEVREGLRTLVEKELELCVANLLETTAEHYEATKEVIEALATQCPQYAISIAESLNTCSRRDDAMASVVRSLSREMKYMSEFEKALDSIENPSLRENLIVDLLRSISDKNKSNLDFKKLYPRVEGMLDAMNRCIGLSLFIAESVGVVELVDKAKERLHVSWDAISGLWVRLDTAFAISALISKKDKAEAERWILKAEDVRQQTEFESGSEVASVERCIDLAIRSFKALLISKTDTKDDLNRLYGMVESLQSPSYQAAFWSRIAFAFFIAGRVEDAKRVVSTKLRPQYELISKDNELTRLGIFSTIAGALWSAHHETTIEEIKRLPPIYRSASIWNIVQFILTKTIPPEPYEVSERHVFNINYEEAYDIVSLLEYTDNDADIYLTIKRLTDTLISLKKNAKVSGEQFALIIGKLEGLVDRKLPSANYIRHEGYKIASEAEIAKASTFDKKRVEKLVDRALAVGNVSDVCFLLTIIAETLPSKANSYKRQLLKDAKSKIAEMSSIYDKLDRYEAVAEAAWEFERKFSQDCIREALELTGQSEDKDDSVIRKEKQLIDLAYRISPDFASSLVSVTDSDPARNKSHSEKTKQIDLYEVRDSMLNEKERLISNAVEKDKRYPEAATKLLSSLNAGRINPVHIGRVRELLYIAGHYPITMSFPLYSWAIENVVRMYGKTAQVEEYSRPAFSAAVDSARLVSEVAAIARRKSRRTAFVKDGLKDAASLQVGPGDRERAIEFVKAWVSRNRPEYLKISEPYFGLDDLEMVKVLGEANPGIRLYILVSEKYLNDQKITKPWDETFEAAWRRRFSEQSPPDTEFVIASVQPNGGSPMHDRWWVGPSCGLRLGTSWNSIGVTKHSDISEFLETEAVVKGKELDRYIEKIERQVNGNRIKYMTFML